MQYRLPIYLLIVTTLFFPLILFSQTILKNSTISGGGGYQINSDYKNKSSIALPIIGKSTSTSNQTYSGFWYTVNSQTFQLIVSVSNGWNMVSVPGINSNGQGVENWWPGRVGEVFRYSGGYQIITTTTLGEGYWMKNAGDQTYNTGDEWPAGGIQIVPHTPITAASGWNLFGGYELSVTAANVTTNPPGLQGGPIYKYSNGYAVATTLDPGYGYWIKLTGTGQIIVPETVAKGEQPVEWFPESWGKIVITDASGINYTLYSVYGEVNLDHYELPPAPPAGMFDIRYESGRIAEDINSSIKAIDMSGVKYPLTVRVEGIGIRLRDETGKLLNVNLKNGEDVVITNSVINKIIISRELIPDKFSLEQNFPNPFNPSTTIRYSVPKLSFVNIGIYNILGELVSVLVDEVQEAGRYNVQFNAAQFASGIYIYKMEADEFTSIKKMILIK